METNSYLMLRRPPGAVVLLLTSWFLIPASAQTANRKSSLEATTERQSKEGHSTRGNGSDLSILTHDATGEIGAPLPSKIELIRSSGIQIRAINVLDLPQGVTINDPVNVFSSSNENKDADISDWDLSNIHLVQNDVRAKTFSFVVAASWYPHGSDQINFATSLITIHFNSENSDHALVANRGEPSGPAENSARQTKSASDIQATATRDTPTSDVMIPEVDVAPLGRTVAVGKPLPAPIPPRQPSAAAEAKNSPSATAIPQPTPQPDPLVERAKGLIQLGDISGARLLLERAQARNAPNATFLLAQTWDPNMLRVWKVRGLRADPELAKSLYAKAAGQQQPTGHQQPEGPQLTATGR